MSALAFDTHAFIKRLTAAGMPEAQAEILADQHTKLIDEKLATKADLAETTRLLKADLAELAKATKEDFVLLRRDLTEFKSATKADIAEAKSEILKWMFGTVGFQTLIIIGAVIALARVVHP
jgi:hypothetical protein